MNCWWSYKSLAVTLVNIPDMFRSDLMEFFFSQDKDKDAGSKLRQVKFHMERYYRGGEVVPFGHSADRIHLETCPGMLRTFHSYPRMSDIL